MPLCNIGLSFTHCSFVRGVSRDHHPLACPRQLPPMRLVRASLAATARYMLSRYPTFLEGSEGLLPSAGAGTGAGAANTSSAPLPRRAAAAMARAGEKRALLALLQALQQPHGEGGCGSSGGVGDGDLEAAVRGAIAAAVASLEARRILARGSLKAAACGRDSSGETGAGHSSSEVEASRDSDGSGGALGAGQSRGTKRQQRSGCCEVQAGGACAKRAGKAVDCVRACKQQQDCTSSQEPAQKAFKFGFM